MDLDSRTCVAVVCGAVCAFYAACVGPRGVVTLRTRELSASAGTYAVGLIAWPFVWFALVGQFVGRAAPLSSIGLLWVPVLLCLDLMWTTRQPLDRTTEERSSFSYEGNSLSSLAFALGGLLVARTGKSTARAATPMLSACILLVVAFVVPSPGVNTHSSSGARVLSGKKVALAYCVGLLLSAVAITMHNAPPPAPSLKK